MFGKEIYDPGNTMTIAGHAALLGGSASNVGMRWRTVLAVFALLAGFAHVWLHYAGPVDADHFGQSVADDCLLYETSLLATVAASADPRLFFHFVVAAPAFLFRIACAYRRPPTRAPPHS